MHVAACWKRGDGAAVPYAGSGVCSVWDTGFGGADLGTGGIAWSPDCVCQDRFSSEDDEVEAQLR